MPGILQLRDLTRRFDCRAVVDHVTFDLQPGVVTGYLGPNGSGKSTTIKMITGLIEPSSGDVFYDGVRIHSRLLEYKKILGYVPEEPHLYSHLSGLEYLELVGQLRGIPEKKLNDKIAGFLRLFDLERDRYAPLASYSKGMRQKILLSAALLHNPEIIILDEPFSGLDVTSTLVLRRFIQALGEAGKLVLYSSHVLEVVEKVCSRVVILHHGKIVADESVAGLRAMMHLPSLEQIFSELVMEQDTGAAARSLLDLMQG